jgi:aminoglycoside N3'-acetyltransferase
MGLPGGGDGAQASVRCQDLPIGANEQSLKRQLLTRSSCNTRIVFHELRVSFVMKNVTVSMEDSVAEWARVEAARRNTSVSRMVGEMLAEKMRHDDAYERAMHEALAFKSFGESTGRYLSRDEIYDRSAR